MAVTDARSNSTRPMTLSPSERTLVATAIRLAAKLDVHGVCAAVLDAAEEIYQARSCWVLLHDARTNDLVTVDFRGADADSYAGARVPLSVSCITTIVFNAREPLFVPDVRAEDRWYDNVRVHRSSLRTVFTVPLVYEGIALGVLGLDCPWFSADALPAPADIERLRAIGAQAALGIRNARQFEAVEEDRQRMRRLLQERRQLRGEVDHLRGEIRDVSHVAAGVVGRSAALQLVLEQVSLVAPADSTVLLVGETGTGKELIARKVHDGSRRASHPFIAVNCAALPEALVESELFGYERGAFTGAVQQKPGKFELANRGTIFLDEIGDLPAPAQAKLLRVLQEREVQRVGGLKALPINVRVIAATNQNLDACMRDGTFRADLYYRLSVFPISLPPLRERREDIEPLLEHFLRAFSERQRRRVPRVGPGVIEQLIAYDWPGNIREFQNVIERAVILARDGVVTPDLLPVLRCSPAAASAHAPEPAQAGAEEVEAPVDARRHTGAHIIPFDEAERRAITHALETTGWRISGHGGAAEMLGLKPTTLHAKMKKLGIRRPSAASAAIRA